MPRGKSHLRHLRKNFKLCKKWKNNRAQTSAPAPGTPRDVTTSDQILLRKEWTPDTCMSIDLNCAHVVRQRHTLLMQIKCSPETKKEEREKERQRDREQWVKYVWGSIQCVQAVMMSASERWNTQSSGTEGDCRDLMMDEGCSEAVFFFCISYSSAPPLLRLIISPVRPRRPTPTHPRVGPPGSYVTCILILPSGITKATSSQLQLIVPLIDYAADYLCDSLVSFQLE